MRRVGFEGRTRVNRHDFGVSWQDHLPGGGLLVSDEVHLVIDVETIHEGDLEKTGAISYYRDGE
jgi:polyisoprenoid-binding protein YceI